MNIGITDIALSSLLPNRISIDTQGDSDAFTLAVKIDGTVIYETTLYAEDDIAYFYDLQMLVSEYMRNRGLTLCKLEVVAGLTAGADSASGWVVYSDFRTSYEIDHEFLQNHYLTTRSYYCIPRSGYQNVAFVILDDEEVPSGYIDACFSLDDGSIHTARVAHTLSDYETTKVYYFTIRASVIETLLKTLYPDDNPHMLSGSVIHGARSLDFYFMDEDPVDYIDFKNAFNIWERYFVYGTTNIKTSFSQKEGVSSGRSVYYNQTSERKVEVETVPLALEEADWLNQCLGSQSVQKTMPPDVDCDILISDVSSEISSSAKDQVTVKFSWRFADPFMWKVYNDINRKFTSVYNETYQ